MKIFYVSRKTLFTVLVLLVLAAFGLLAVFLLLTPWKWLANPVKTPHYQGKTGTKTVSLTFNVDWGEDKVPPLLQILRENQIKATFFVTGRWAEKNRELLKEIVGQGHELGNHGARHRHLRNLGREDIKKEMKEGADILYEITGVKTVLYAPAFGEYDRRVGEAAAELGYEVILWSLDTIDWQNPDVATIVARVVPRIHNDAIILMHPTTPTIQALPEIIKKLKDQGYRFCPVSEIIK